MKLGEAYMKVLESWRTLVEHRLEQGGEGAGDVEAALAAIEEQFGSDCPAPEAFRVAFDFAKRENDDLLEMAIKKIAAHTMGVHQGRAQAREEQAKSDRAKAKAVVDAVWPITPEQIEMNHDD